jgi:hypothetical protein
VVVVSLRGQGSPRRAARAAGCTCSLIVVVSDVEQEACVYHDDWCALLRRGDVN